MRNVLGIFVFVAVLVFGQGAFATTTSAEIPETLTQSDGYTFTGVLRGNRHQHWMETEAGHTIIQSNGNWYYAEPDNQGSIRPSANRVGVLTKSALDVLPLHLKPAPSGEHQHYGPVFKYDNSQKTISHTQYVLTILVDYNDISFTYTDSSFQSLMYGASNSVKEFFLENSYNRFTVAAPTESYGTANDGIIHITRGINHPNLGGGDWRSEARTITSEVDSYIDFSAYDSDSNGSVEADELSVVIILAGYENSYNSSTPTAWGHKWNFATSLTADGVTLSPYTIFGERHGTHQATIGIMCHELGHLMLGLPDLYDTNASNGDSEGIGEWGLMGSGSWNDDGGFLGNSPAHLSAWCKVTTTFTDPVDVDTSSTSVSLASAHGSEVAKRIWIDPYKAPTGEYFLLENRQQSGYDVGLPYNGLMIFHIDGSQSSNGDETNKWVDVEAADGDTDLDDEVNRGDAGDPFPGTSSNTTFNGASAPDSDDYDSNATGIAVTNISASSATMTVDITPRTGGVGDNEYYWERLEGWAWGTGAGTTYWGAQRVTNNTSMNTFDGIDLYCTDTATVDVYFYSSYGSGTFSSLVGSQTGFACSGGWNRLLLTTPLSFPLGTDRYVVFRIVNSSNTYPLAIDYTGSDSGRNYATSAGNGSFGTLGYDINMVSLLSGSDTTAPTADSITPDYTETNDSSMDFTVVFSEDVMNFNNSSDVTINHTGTSHSGVSVSGSGDTYTVTVTGISGTGSFTLAVNTGSDVEDTASNALTSSVTSSSVSVDPTIFVDFDFGGTELGTVSYPYNSISEALADVGTDEKIKIDGTASDTESAYTGTISGAMELLADPAGSVRIGVIGAGN